jgi:hypothetical protein
MHIWREETGYCAYCSAVGGKAMSVYVSGYNRIAKEEKGAEHT